jgi:xylulokinase
MRTTGHPPGNLVAVGGGAQSDYWLQVIATTLGTPIAVPQDGDFGAAFGAARLGMLAAGWTPDATLAPPKTRHLIEPDPSKAAAFDEAYHRYRALYGALKDLS